VQVVCPRAGHVVPKWSPDRLHVVIVPAVGLNDDLLYVSGGDQPDTSPVVRARPASYQPGVVSFEAAGRACLVRAHRRAVAPRPFPAGSGYRCVTVRGNERRHVAADTPAYTPTVVERSGPAIRAALLAHAPERCRQFEDELRSALALTTQNLDLAGPQAVLAHWQAVAMMAANPLTAEEREQVERAKASDFSGLLSWHQDENGSWVRL